MLTWEGSQTQGKSNILDDLMVSVKVKLLLSTHLNDPYLTFPSEQKPELKALKTIVSKVDAMPSIANTILVCVTGNLAVSTLILYQPSKCSKFCPEQCRLTTQSTNPFFSRRPSFWRLFQDNLVDSTSTIRISDWSPFRNSLYIVWKRAALHKYIKQVLLS